MNAYQIHTIRESWDRLSRDADGLAADFYQRLFERAPEVRPMFKRDMIQQARMLTTVIGLAVRSLDKLDTLVPVVRELGGRHANYGVRDDQYAIVGGTLLDTFAERLGADFTPDLREAWTKAYTVLANTMIEGAKEVRVGIAA